MLLQFNKNTGFFYNNIPIAADSNIQCIAISHDNTKLYLETGKICDRIYQFELSNWNQANILLSRNTILTTNQFYSSDFQNALDGKIYGSNIQSFYLNIIHNPNGIGLNCNFIPNDIYLGGRLALGELPDFIQSFFDDSAGSCYTSVHEIENNTIHVFPNFARDWVEIRKNDFEQVQLYDITGRLVYTSSIIAISPELRINVSSFSRGIYIVSLSSKQKSFIQKVVLY